MPETQTHDTNEADRFPVVIIGGGLAGLMAASHLAAAGVPPLLLEADQLWAGGRLSGGEPDIFMYGGREWAFNPDHGVHAIWGNYVNMRAALERFTQTPLQESTGEEWINRWRREVRSVEAGSAVREGWIPAPFHYLHLLFRPRFWKTITPFDFLSLPGYLFSTLWAVGFDPLKERSALDGLNMKEFFRGWTPNLRVTFRGLGANLLAAPPEAISVSAFIAAIRFYTVLRRDAWRMQYLMGDSHTQLIQPLMKHIRDLDGMVMQGVTAIRLERDGHCWKILVEDANRKGLRSTFAEQIIIATNAPAAARLLLQSPDLAERAEKITFPAGLRNVVIRLWFDTQPREGTASGMFTGDFILDNFFWLHRLYPEFTEWAETGGSAMEVHLYGEDALLDLPDRNLIIQAVDEVQRAFPEVKGHFVHAALRRNSKVQTRFRVPTDDSLWVNTPWPGVYAAGDWIGFDTPSLWMERATVTGIAAANEILCSRGHAAYPILRPLAASPVARFLGLFVRLIRLIFAPLVWAARRVKQRNT